LATKNRMHKLAARRRGSGWVLVLLAMSMIALLATPALVLDGGRIYVERGDMQNAADAAVLAGGRTLALGGTADEARATAALYAVTYNGADSANVSIDPRALTVVTCQDVPVTFVRIIGLDATVVCARATAKFGPIGWAEGLNPIAARDFPYQFDTLYVI
jgi:uncharacterized membrane protein